MSGDVSTHAFEKKWGVTVQRVDPPHVAMIAAVQCIVLILALYVLRPSIVMHKTSSLKVATVDVLRLILIPVVFTAFTFYWPLFCTQ